MSEYVTEADLRAWCPWGGVRESTHESGLSITERRKRYGFGTKKEERVKVEVTKAKQPKPKKEPSVRRVPVEKTKYYQKSISNAQATVRALELVNELKYDLSARTTAEERQKRIVGWHIFCQAVTVLYKEYSVRGISDALTIPNAPSRPLLDQMFQSCRDSPYSFDQIKKMLNLE